MSEDGSSSRWEEGVDFVFPDDGANKPTLLLMAKAAEWKRRNEEKERADGKWLRLTRIESFRFFETLNF